MWLVTRFAERIIDSDENRFHRTIAARRDLSNGVKVSMVRKKNPHHFLLKIFRGKRWHRLRKFSGWSTKERDGTDLENFQGDPQRKEMAPTFAVGAISHDKVPWDPRLVPWESHDLCRGGPTTCAVGVPRLVPWESHDLCVCAVGAISNPWFLFDC
jgi:hypothetical protein